MSKQIIPPTLEDFTQSFDHNYQSTATVNHQGMIIAFAMDTNRRIYYSILDMEQDANPVDARNWKNPRWLRFPEEIAQVGYSVVSPVRLPAVKAVFDAQQKEVLKFDKDNNIETPEEKLEETEKSAYWSSTARLTGDAPIQALSDQKYVYVFRQAIRKESPPQLFIQKDGTVSATKTDYVKDVDGNQVPLVNQTLLVDRFVLARKKMDEKKANSPFELRLESKREVRYRRSRNKTRPQSAKDSLGAIDMEGNPFYEPTSELTFVNNLTSGRFAVLLLSTGSAELNRWQIFSYNSKTDQINSFNIECSRDGLFNTEGTQLYTSPDPQYRDSVLERQPGTCPFTKQPLVPFGQGSGMEQSSFSLMSGTSKIELQSGLAAQLFYQQEPTVTPADSHRHDPLAKPLKRAARVLLAAVTKANQIAALDFPLSQAGQLSKLHGTVDLKTALPAIAPAASQELATITQDERTGLITYGGLLNVGASDKATPVLFESANGKVALYYQGKDDKKSYVLHYDTRAARAQGEMTTRYDVVVGKLAQEIKAGQTVSVLQLEKAAGGEIGSKAILLAGTERFTVKDQPKSGSNTINVTAQAVSQSIPQDTLLMLACGGPPLNPTADEVAKSKLALVARATGKWANDATITVSDDTNPSFCAVTIQAGSKTETFKRVPRAAQQFADVLNGKATGKTYLAQALIGDDELLNGITSLKLSERKAAVVTGDRVQLGAKGRFTAGVMGIVAVDGKSVDTIANGSSPIVDVILAEEGTFVYLEKEYLDGLKECRFQPGAEHINITLANYMIDRNNVASGDRLTLDLSPSHNIPEPALARSIAQLNVLERKKEQENGHVQFSCKTPVLLAAGTELFSASPNTYFGTLARDWSHTDRVVSLDKTNLTVLHHELFNQTGPLALTAGPWEFVCAPAQALETATTIELPVSQVTLKGDFSVYRSLDKPRPVGQLKRDWSMKRNGNLSGAIELSAGDEGLRDFDVLSLGNQRVLFNQYVVLPGGLQPAIFFPIYQAARFSLPAYRLDYDYGFYTSGDGGVPLQHSRLLTVQAGLAEGMVQNGSAKLAQGAACQWVAEPAGKACSLFFNTSLASAATGRLLPDNDLTIESWVAPAPRARKVLTFGDKVSIELLAADYEKTDPETKRQTGMDELYLGYPSTHPNGITIETWVYFDSFAQSNRLIEWGNNSSNGVNGMSRAEDSNIVLGTVDGSKKLEFYVSNTQRLQCRWQSVDDVFPEKQWAHIAVSLSVSGEAKLYVNGIPKQLQETTPFANWKSAIDAKHPFLVDPKTRRSSLLIGQYFYHNSSASYFHGKMSEVRLWSAVRTPEQIARNLYTHIDEHLATFEGDVYLDLVENQNKPAHAEKRWGPPVIGMWCLSAFESLPVVTMQDKNSSSYYGIGLKNDLAPYAQVGLKRIEATAPLPATGDGNSWTHLAAVYRQAYGLQFDGQAGTNLNCGKDRSLDLAGDLTIELFLQLDKDATGAQSLVAKGTLGDNQTVSYALYLNLDKRLVFACEDQSGTLFTCVSDTLVPTGTPVSLAVTRKRTSFSKMEGKGDERKVASTNDFYDIRFYVNGLDAGQPPLLPATPDTSTAPTGDYNDQADELLAANGYDYFIAHPDKKNKAYTALLPKPASACTDKDDRLKRAFTRRYFLKRRGDDVYKDIGHNEQELIVGQTFKGVIGEVRLWDCALSDREVCQRTVASDAKGLLAWWRFEERLGRAANDSKGENHARIRGAMWVKDPDPLASSLKLYANARELSTRAGAAEAINGTSFTLGGSGFNGQLDEVRIWNVPRTPEQLQDNLFSRLKGETKDLIAYYPFENDANKGQDRSFRSNHLTGNAATALSSAPISDDIPLVVGGFQNALYQVAMDSAPSVQEYADLQLDSAGNLTGSYKRCYSFIRDTKWLLVTGYKVGNVRTEWIGQAQSNPQVIGYIEGAPPVPGENLTDPGKNITKPKDYTGASAVEFGDATITKSIYSTSRDAGFDYSIDMKLKGGFGMNVEGGFGLITDISKTKLLPGVHSTVAKTLSDTEKTSLTHGFNQSNRLRLELHGAWEQKDPSKYINAAVGRRFIPANTGLALVESETMDVYALRLEHNHALVAYRLSPNPDVLRDRNLIPFPINTFYTKQGTLDGKVGCKEDGSAQCDPDYPMATGYGEYSYYKPKEAYLLKKRIQREQKELETYYNQYKTEASGDTPTLGGTAFSTRNLVDAYIWTSERGFYAETTTSMKAMHYTSSGRYSFQWRVGPTAKLDFKLVGAAFGFDIDALFGNHLEHILTKDKDDEQDYNLTVDAKGESDIQLYANTQAELAKYACQNEVGGVYDEEGRAVDRPGKVDAYRFMTFWLAPTPDNFEDLTSKVIDPIWLSQSKSPYALALRQATQAGGGCWRVMHRVTFVSRVHSDFENSAPLQKAARRLDIKSNWELIQTLAHDPNVESKRGDFVAFCQAVRSVVQQKLPELVPHTQEIIQFMCDYYQVYDE